MLAQSPRRAMPDLILASSSPYRRALLERLGLPFEAVSPDIDETPRAGEASEALALRLAAAKAAKVAEARPDAVIIASDQVAVAEGPEGHALLGKPGNRANAIAQLNRLSGSTARFLTSLCVRQPDGGEQLEVQTTEVRFRMLGPREITRYVDRDRPFDCAGAFRSEGLGIALFEHIEGNDPNALIGLPLILLCQMLRRANFDPLA